MALLDDLLAQKTKPELCIMDIDLILYFIGHHLRDQMNMLGKVAFKEQALKRVEGFLDRCKADYYIGFYSSTGRDNFRHKFATITPYKGHRKKEEYVSYFEPVCYEFFKEIGFHDMKLQEADDAVIVAANIYKNDYNITFVNVDKDLKQYGAVKQFNPRKNEFETWTYEEGRKFFWSQHIMGDTADAIKGIPGQGKKSKYITSINNLDPYTEEAAYSIVKNAYLEKFGDNAFGTMVENHMLLKMLDRPLMDYDPEVIVPIKYEKKRKSINIMDI